MPAGAEVGFRVFRGYLPSSFRIPISARWSSPQAANFLFPCLLCVFASLWLTSAFASLALLAETRTHDERSADRDRLPNGPSKPGSRRALFAARLSRTGRMESGSHRPGPADPNERIGHTGLPSSSRFVTGRSPSIATTAAVVCESPIGFAIKASHRPKAWPAASTSGRSKSIPVCRGIDVHAAPPIGRAN